MPTYNRHQPSLCLLTALLLHGVIGTQAEAEIILDGTLGSNGALTGPNFEIPAELGAQRVANLFHSFEKFNLNQRESATFTGPEGLDNVISRVTGGESSSIDGLLRSRVPGADFWFLNPAGVMFGPNAELDVPASFHVSTANELRFGDGVVFSATDPGASTLTVALPEAFGFLGESPAGIAVEESHLQVTEEETLSPVAWSGQRAPELVRVPLGTAKVGT